MPIGKFRVFLCTKLALNFFSMKHLFDEKVFVSIFLNYFFMIFFLWKSMTLVWMEKNDDLKFLPNNFFIDFFLNSENEEKFIQ